jgi:CheY-specific phosphatase CheX
MNDTLFPGKIIIILLVFTGLLSACNSDTTNVFGSIEGEVRGQKSGSGIVINPPPYVSGAQVTLLSDGKTLHRYTTKAGGKFEFHNLDAGEYAISVRKDGFETDYSPVSVISGEITNISVLLIGE